MATTTYFGWETPDDTDLVKDGAAAIRTLGSAIDTSMSQLEGGTTGQVLSKTSATDMAVTWTNGGDITEVTAGTGISGGGSSGAVTVTNSMATAITTAGDLIKGTGSGTFNRLGIGTTGQILTVASGAPSWATASAPADSFSVIGTGTTTSGTSVTVSGISGMNSLMILFKGISGGSASMSFSVRINGDTGLNYNHFGALNIPAASYSPNNFSAITTNNDDRIYCLSLSTNATSTASGYMIINGCNSAGVKTYNFASGSDDGGGNANDTYSAGGYWNNTAVVTSINLTSVGGSFDAGSFVVLGSA